MSPQLPACDSLADVFGFDIERSHKGIWPAQLRTTPAPVPTYGLSSTGKLHQQSKAAITFGLLIDHNFDDC